ncbi:MAG: HPr family phosphocarrier protein [Chloracidobacterium sp.]|nr:HPr family phosphocarrier protein [Chloracidobacterium sp.]
MRQRTVKVVNVLGLHARAAGQLVRVAKGFKSRIRLVRCDGRAEADAKSMLSVLALAAAFDTLLEIQAEGEDEAEALEAVGELFAGGFGEIELLT